MGIKQGNLLILLVNAMLEFYALKCLPYTCRDWLKSPTLVVHVHVTTVVTLQIWLPHYSISC